MLTSAQTVAKKIVNFHKDFLDRRTNVSEEIVCKKSEKPSSEESNNALKEKWLIENYKMNEFRKLQKEIEGLVSLMQKLQKQA